MFRKTILPAIMFWFTTKKAGDWIAYYDINGDWCEARECIPFKDVTHWMPMPEPPTED